MYGGGGGIDGETPVAVTTLECQVGSYAACGARTSPRRENNKAMLTGEVAGSAERLSGSRSTRKGRTPLSEKRALEKLLEKLPNENRKSSGQQGLLSFFASTRCILS